jgi:hypothetical protein
MARCPVKPPEPGPPRVDGDAIAAVRYPTNVKSSIRDNCSQHYKAMRDLLGGERAREHVRECTPDEFPFRVSHIQRERVP